MLKTADLAKDLTYATKERFSGTAYPGLLLEKVMWCEKDEWANWDGAENRSRARIVRRAPGVRAEGHQGWGRDYQKTGLPVLVLKLTDWNFTEGAKDNQVVESPASILERARDAMNVMGLVADTFDGRPTATTRKSITIRVQTVKGIARKVVAELELMRPQQFLSQWGPFVKAQAREREARKAIAEAVAKRKDEGERQAYDFSRRITELLGDEENARYTDSSERYDFHRKWTGDGTSRTYEVSADVIEKLLALAEKGASA